MWTYRGFVIKPYVVICNGYKYSILESDGITHVTSARTKKECKEEINYIIEQRSQKETFWFVAFLNRIYDKEC